MARRVALNDSSPNVTNPVAGAVGAAPVKRHGARDGDEDGEADEMRPYVARLVVSLEHLRRRGRARCGRVSGQRSRSRLAKRE